MKNKSVKKAVFSNIIMLVYEFWGRVYDIPSYLKYYNIKKGDVVIDVGAYTGLFTKYAAKKVGEKGKVIAFEPDPANIKILKKRLNGIKNVILIQKGLFDCDDVLNLKRHWFIGTIGSTTRREKDLNDSFKVKVTTLDKELKRRGISSLNFIKIDIEGAEIEAVNGMKKTIKRFHPDLAIACYHKRNNQRTCIPLKKTLSAYYFNLKTGCLFHPSLFAQNKYAKK